MPLTQIKRELRKHGTKEKAKVLQSFFKTGPGQYGEGDIFLGVQVPYVRKIAKQYKNLPLNRIAKLLNSNIHEERLLALLMLVMKFKDCASAGKKKIYNFYLNNTKHVNNWDLVDLTAHHILGNYLTGKNKKMLYTLAGSKSMWQRRMAIVATFYFIRRNNFKDTLRIAKTLLYDKEDLIHKAVGWMLREVGKRNVAAEESFLRKHHRVMPRTMLRYAIERFPATKRKAYLKGRA